MPSTRLSWFFPEQVSQWCMCAGKRILCIAGLTEARLNNCDLLVSRREIVDFETVCTPYMTSMTSSLRFGLLVRGHQDITFFRLVVTLM